MTLIEFLRSVLKAVSLNAEYTSECTAADAEEDEKEKALLGKPPGAEYGQIRRILQSATVSSNRGKSEVHEPPPEDDAKGPNSVVF